MWLHHVRMSGVGALDFKARVYVFNGTQLYYPERLPRLEYTAQHPFAEKQQQQLVRVRLVELGAVQANTDAHRMLLNVCLRAAEMRGLKLTPMGASRGVFDLERRHVIDERNRYQYTDTHAATEGTLHGHYDFSIHYTVTLSVSLVRLLCSGTCSLKFERIT